MDENVISIDKEKKYPSLVFQHTMTEEYEDSGGYDIRLVEVHEDNFILEQNAKDSLGVDTWNIINSFGGKDNVVTIVLNVMREREKQFKTE